MKNLFAQSAQADKLTLELHNIIRHGMNFNWCVDDILSVDATLTDIQCAKVLLYMKNNHNAEIGINRNVIAITIDELKNQCLSQEV